MEENNKKSKLNEEQINRSGTPASVSRGRLFIQFLCLCMGSTLIYYVPYHMKNYYNLVLEALKINNTQFGMLGTVYGLTTLITYLPGGWMADRFSARKLLSLSYIMSGLLQLYFLTFPPFAVCIPLYFLMGIFATLTFWPAMIKATRQFAKAGSEGKTFGGLEAGHGVVAFGLGTVMTVVFAATGAGLFSLRLNVLVYAILCFIMGTLTFVTFSDSPAEKTNKIGFSNVKEGLSHPSVWMISFIVFGIYSASLATGYMNALFTNSFGTSMMFAVIVGQIRSYFRPVGAYAGGIISDRIGKAKTMLIFTVTLMAAYGIICLVPPEPSFIYPVAGISCLITIITALTWGQSYALMSEGNVPMYLTGIAVGIISTIGFIGDSFFPLMVGIIFDRYPGITGHRIMFGIGIGFGLQAVIMLLIFMKVNRNRITPPV